MLFWIVSTPQKYYVQRYPQFASQQGSVWKFSLSCVALWELKSTGHKTCSCHKQPQLSLISYGL